MTRLCLTANTIYCEATIYGQTLIGRTLSAHHDRTPDLSGVAGVRPKKNLRIMNYSRIHS